MTFTEIKLNEAKFFFRKLKKDDPNFDYYLSAFLNSARSISWVMRFEFSKVNSWEKWFENVDVDFREKEVMNEINQLRIRSTKQSGVITSLRFLNFLIPDKDSYPQITDMLESLKEGEEFEITISEKLPNAVSSKIENGWVITGELALEEESEDKAERDLILSLCKDYLEFMEKQVNDCLENFKEKK